MKKLLVIMLSIHFVGVLTATWPVRMNDHLKLRGCAERSASSHNASIDRYIYTY
jgi:hypothetical protein